ncbi:MAG: FtsX-like permease family protein [bacterium]|nr:FtsX-like permease family protein [bacterium]
MFDLGHDLRTTLRGFRSRPWSTLVAVSILAIGLAAAIAVFTYVNGFYQPFPGVDDDGLVRLFEVEAEDAYQDLSYLDFLDYAASTEAFEGVAAVRPYHAASVRLESMTEVAFLEAVSGEAFSVLGVETVAGRGLLADDDRPGADPVAVISYRWWQRSFSGDESAIGTTIYLNYRPFTVVGVASPAFLGSASDFRPEVWIPIAPFRDRYKRFATQAENRDVPLVRVYGRLRDGVREEQGRAELAAIASGLDELHPREQASRRLDLDAATWIDPRSRLDEWSTVRLMMAAAGALLLLVCANVANLILSVAVKRQREMSVRAALGASPGRLVRQVLIENVVLSSLAGVAALVLAGPAAARLGAYFARPSVWGENVAREAAVDLRVVAFALAVALVTGVLAGLMPAFKARSRDLLTTLKSADSSFVPLWGNASAATKGRIWGRRIPGMRDLLVSTQVALSVVLLVVAGLVLRTLRSVGDLDPGIPVESMVVTHISTSSTDLEVAERDLFFRDLAARLDEQPWVRSATVADYPVLSPHASTDLLLDGHDEPISLVFSNVIPGFFDALDIDVRQGRAFTETDVEGSRDVAVVNEALARRYFPGTNAIGKSLRRPDPDGEAAREYAIVGIARDTKTQDLFAEPPPTVYFSYPQHRYPTGSALLIAAHGDPRAAVPQLYRWLRDYEPYLAIINVVAYRDVVQGFLYTHRMNAEMFSLLAFLGLALSAVGIWSVVSLAVSSRTREIGIRVAIGARRSDIGRLILGRSLASVVLGLIGGLAVSFALAGLMRGLLHGIEPTDPLTLAAGVGLLVLAAAAAAYLPARRAWAVDPTIALRQE